MAGFDDFKPGDRVQLARVRHEDYRGKTGVVRKCIKSRRMIRLDVDGMNPKLTTSVYEALPTNLDKLDN